MKTTSPASTSSIDCPCPPPDCTESIRTSSEGLVLGLGGATKWPERPRWRYRSRKGHPWSRGADLTGR
jgi:hypothetical protein